jgi:hypothetical protein
VKRTDSVGHSALLFARILRLTGVSLFVVYIVLAELTYLLSFSNPSPEVGHTFVIIIAISLVSFALGVPLALIGDRISPPDPWLDFWLDRLRFRKSLKPVKENEPSEMAGISATATATKNWMVPSIGGKCLVEFERGSLFLIQPGKDDILVAPKKVLRTGNLTLVIDTGIVLSYGKVTLTFSSASDADTVEREVAKLIGHA